MDAALGHAAGIEDAPCFLIAEAGVNHNGDLSRACLYLLSGGARAMPGSTVRAYGRSPA